MKVASLTVFGVLGVTQCTITDVSDITVAPLSTLKRHLQELLMVLGKEGLFKDDCNLIDRLNIMKQIFHELDAQNSYDFLRDQAFDKLAETFRLALLQKDWDEFDDFRNQQWDAMDNIELIYEESRMQRIQEALDMRELDIIEREEIDADLEEIEYRERMRRVQDELDQREEEIMHEMIKEEEALLKAEQERNLQVNNALIERESEIEYELYMEQEQFTAEQEANRMSKQREHQEKLDAREKEIELELKMDEDQDLLKRKPIMLKLQQHF